jgi:hypothetical protein
MNETDVARAPKGALLKAITDAEPGDRILYHTGEHCGGPHRHDASWAHDAGLAILVQRRSKTPGLFDYLAVRTRKKEGEK